MERIRNFCIIAHIDHGKSTLADRFLELTGTVPARVMREQYLDTMELERERGITIKLQPVRMSYQGYELNLIDTPGHVDFSYEVSRSLSSVEGAILLVDATQGIEAQTLANFHLAEGENLVIIPVINKIDQPAADPPKMIKEMQAVLGIKPEEILLVSAKTGEGVEEVLEAIIERVPPPAGLKAGKLRALVFDSYFDPFRGVVAYLRVVDGSLKRNDKLLMMASQAEAEALEVGYFAPSLTPQATLKTGEIGYVATGLKDLRAVRVGETITKAGSPERGQPLPGYKRVMPFVYAGIFTVDNDDFHRLREALLKLSLNDAALVFEAESSPALGFGFRCGFLGLLHLDIVQERLEREFNLNLVTTTPSVSYRLTMKSGAERIIHHPSELRAPHLYQEIAEPWVRLEIISPSRYLGKIMQLAQERRGVKGEVKYLDPAHALLVYEIPLASIIAEFYDQLKSISAGYASLAYEFIGYRPSNLVKVDLLLNGKAVDVLSVMVQEKEVFKVGQGLVAKLKELLPRQNFRLIIQAARGGKIIAREEIASYRKDVLAKLYGGDRTRKDKLLQKQRKGKRRMKMVGKVEIPQEAFRKLLSF